MDFITLENPKSFSSETAIKNDDYYRVYNFKANKNTKCFYQGNEITIDDCREKIQYDGIECRLYDNNAKILKTSQEFKGDGTNFKKTLVAFFGIATFAYLTGKN